MRIRKHAKISAMLSNTSSSGHHSAQSHVCQLNQSPWDVIIFPPNSSSTPPYQVVRDDSFTGNGSFGDSIGAVESVASMKISMEEDKDTKEDGPEEGKGGERRFRNSQIILCCKTDGKGWQCKREAMEGHSLCEHHLTQLRNYNSLAYTASKKSDKYPEKEKTVIRRRVRAKNDSSANPHQFYYYSGFGPLWGKKRCNRPAQPNKSKTNEAKLEVEVLTTSSSSPSPSPLPLPKIDGDEFDYIEDDDDEEEEENMNDNGDTGKKRARKPIKARSLKSLM